MGNDDEVLFFADESEESRPPVRESALPGWKILVVDDDLDVHEATVLALSNTPILDRPLDFLHAHSAREALEILERERDIAVILLDVVMETEDAGLRTVSAIREQLGLSNVRIILRTGQPGRAPEIDTISRYDINDYKTKSELTRNKLFTTLTTAIRSYNQLKMLENSRRGLEKIVAASNQFIAEQGLKNFADGVITQIAGLIGIEPEGVICAGEAPDGPDGPHYRIVAAAGKYRQLIEHRLEEIDEPSIVEALSHCLRQQRSQIGSNSVTLYFSERNSPIFAAYVDSAQPLLDVDQHLLEVFCTNISLCADNVHLVARLRQQAFEDPLVGLPNRLAFISEVDRRLQQDPAGDGVIALVDIDQFSGINDMLGHQYGDQLLKAVAAHLRRSLSADSFVARVASDIFGVVGEAAYLTPETLQPLFARPLSVGSAEQSITTSIGLVRLQNMETSGSDFLKDAHIALKRAKTGGLSQVAWYSRDIGTETRERAILLQNLRGAFDHRRLFVAFQPQVDLASRELVGFEALMRWRSDDGTLVPPERFIPVAEHSGLIVPLGTWMLRTALHALGQMQAVSRRPLRMAANVSVVQLRQPGFAQLIDDALRDTGIDPAHLEVEITESVAILGLDHIASLLGEIKQRGVQLAIDDFGTGYSSLSYIDKLPVDRIKIDRAFVTPLDKPTDGARIVELVIPMGHRLGMQVIAEGVETEAQRSALLELDCDEGQGFLFSRAMPLEDALKWITA